MSTKIVSHVIQPEATERSLGAKSSNWSNTIPAPAGSNQKLFQRKSKKCEKKHCQAAHHRHCPGL